MSEFDPTPYQRIPQLSTRRTISLATRLLAKQPRDLPSEGRSAAKKVRAALADLKAVYAAKTSQAPPRRPDRKGADRRADNAWAALHDRTRACSYLPADEYPASAEASGLLEQLFPTGLAFLAYEYEAEWAEGDSKLQAIDTRKLAPTLDRIAGPEYLAEVRRAHALYGDALGMTRQGAASQPKPESQDIAGPRDALRKAIAGYCRKLVGLVDEDDAASIERTTDALSPVVEARSKPASGRDDDDDEDDKDEPASPVVTPVK